MEMVALLGVIAAVVPAAAASASALIPPGFRLEASNGYGVRGLFFDGTPHEGRDELFLLVVGKHSAVAYLAPAQADETSVSAQLGAVGSVDLHFVPSGRPRSERTCGTPKSVRVESGFYEGTVDLRGEEGYMRAHATRVAAEARTLLSLGCGRSSDEGIGGYAPGARLTVARRRGPERIEFVARKNSPTRVARFEASIEERVGKVTITRVVTSIAAPSSFRFDVPDGEAALRPGGPFRGGAEYDGDRGSFHRLSGDLGVDFPGNSGVPLTGPGTRAGMIRYVDNPSHPFRLPGLDEWLTTRP